MADTTRPVAASPLSQLPPEILIRILHLHVNDTLRSFDRPACSPLATRSPYSWIRVTHVCRQWRAVCLACPLLWSSIILTHRTDLMQALLARSQQVPLDVRSSGGTGCFLSRPFPLKSLRLVLAELHRVRSIEVAINWWMYDDVASLLERPAPHLRRFALTTPNGGYDGGWACPVLSVGSEDEPLQLESLSLNCYMFPWSDPLPFRTLKSLEIDNRGLRKPSIEEVAFALGNMPNLVKLVLQGVLYGGNAQLLARARPDVIQLDQLEQLTLSGDSLSCATLVRLLNFPSTTSVQLDFTSDKYADTLALSVDAIGHKLLPSKLRHLHLTHGRTCMLSFREAAFQTRLRIFISSEVDHVETLCRNVQLMDSCTLCMTPYPEASHWPSLFRHFDDLQGLNLTGWHPTDVASLLSVGLDGPVDRSETEVVDEHLDGDDRPGIIFPNLRTLELYSIDFTGKAKELREALHIRSERKLVLDRLALWNCSGLDEADIIGLSKVVRDFIIPCT